MFKDHYGFINSSLVAFFHITVLVLAPFFARLFPTELGIAPILATLLLPILLFWYFFLLRNHVDTRILFVCIPILALVCAFFAVWAAIKGSPFEETLPIITPLTTPLASVPLLNLFFVSYTGSAPILASVVMYYAALNYIISGLIAGLLELSYDRVLRAKLPQALSKKLAQLDVKIDQGAFLFLDKNLFMRQNVGAAVIAAILVCFTALYTLVLLAF